MTIKPVDNAPSQPVPADQDDAKELARRALEHRFRHSLRSGQLSPLLHLMVRYKAGALS